MSWEYTEPVRIVFGNGKIHEIRNYMEGICNPLLITEPFFLDRPVVQEIKKECGIKSIFSDISQNPDITQVNACSKQIREEQIGGIIALGGGSTIDLAKAASIAVERIEEYHWNGKKVPDKHLPIIAIPTTAGTGSEVTCVSVLTDRKRRYKAPIVSNSFYPVMAVIDPELTYTLSPYLTAASGIDVLCHAVEGYWSKGHQPICDVLAIHAIKLVMEYLPIAYDNPKHSLAREKMAEASVIAGMAFTLPKTTSSHACSFPLTNIYKIPHGEACGLTIDYFIRVNGSDEHANKLFDALGYRNADAFAKDVEALKKTLKLRQDLKDFHLSETQIRELVKESHHPNMLNNPVSVTDEILFELYNKLS
ncbi:iron-containing alcohol dehydrogenase [bacterium 210820-DFI.6.37]|nr:iron-containing alcohol dehydrogenase [bacterium 210820-DFI.6.37]